MCIAHSHPREDIPKDDNWGLPLQNTETPSPIPTDPPLPYSTYAPPEIDYNDTRNSNSYEESGVITGSNSAESIFQIKKEINSNERERKGRIICILCR